MPTKKEVKAFEELRKLIDKVHENPMSKEELQDLFGKKYDFVVALVQLLKSEKRTNEEIIQLITQIVKGQLFLTPHATC